MNVGDRLGKYTLTRPLGEGAMGAVWAAVHEDTQREVALKLLHEPSEELRQRLLREAVACGRLDHRNVVAIHDVGATPAGEPFLVMQLLSGESLGQRLRREGKVTPQEAARIGAAIASGLGAAHSVGIVHRDLKPDNVFLHRETGGRDEVVKLLDFGVSRLDVVGSTKLTATGDLLGSPAYMSPEQASGLTRIGPLSDIWSLGVVLFQMIAGRRPFPGPSLADTIVQVVSAPIPSLATLEPQVRPELAALVHACLQREPEQRPGSAADLSDRLLACASLDPRANPGPPASAGSMSAGSASMGSAAHLPDDDPLPPLMMLPSAYAAAGGRAPRLPATGLTTPVIATSPGTTPQGTTPMVKAPQGQASTFTTPMLTTPMLRGAPQLAGQPSASGSPWGVLLIAAGTLLIGVGILIAVLMVRGQPGSETSPSSSSNAATAMSTTNASRASETPGADPRRRTSAAPSLPDPSGTRAPPTGPTVPVILSVDVPAQVFLDDRAVGITPMAALDVPLGTHTLRFKHVNFGERSLTVEVKQGVPMAITVDFSKSGGADDQGAR